MEKELVKQLLAEWHRANLSVLYEHSCSIDKDIAKLAAKAREWERKLGLDPSDWPESD